MLGLDTGSQTTNLKPQTQVLVSTKAWFRTNIIANIKYHFLCGLGRVLQWMETGKQYREIRKRYESRMNHGRLTEDELQEISKYQSKKVNRSVQRRGQFLINENDFKSIPHQNLSLQHRAAFRLEELLKNEAKEVKTILNVGARVDHVSAYLAKKFTDKKFISLDLQEDLKSHNSALPQSENWEFVSGYAIDLFNTNQLQPELVFATSTTVLFNNKEMDVFIESLPDSVQYVFLNEPWTPKYGLKNVFKIPRPEEIPNQQPYCGIERAFYHHNYIKKFGLAGFQVISCNILPSSYPGSYLLQFVAKKTVH